MAALQYINVPGYAAIIFRKTYADLALPGALMDRAQQWLSGTEATFDKETKTWHFPSGSTMSFGYLDTANDHYRYQGAEFQTICVDELTQIPEYQYLYLFSRLRRLKGSNIPIRMRAGTNPGNIGHQWVKERFIIGTHEDRVFVPSRLEDNLALDRDEYIKSLDNLDPITRRQLLQGDWSDYEGGRFKKEWFRRYHITETTYDLYKKVGDRWEMTMSWPKDKCWKFGTCDPAASTKNTADYTAAGAWAVTPANDLLCLEILHQRMDLERIVPTLCGFCKTHGLRYMAIEDVGFQKMIILEGQRYPGMPPVRGISPASKGKLERATPAIIRAEGGQIYLPERAYWMDDYIAELLAFTGDPDKDAFDDQVDCTSTAALEMDRMGTLHYPDFKQKERESLKPQSQGWHGIKPTNRGAASHRGRFGRGY